MALRYSAEDRRRLGDLAAEKRRIEAPLKLADKLERKAERKGRGARDQRIHHDTGKADRGRVVDKVYRAWIRQLPCVAGLVRPRECAGGVEAAHVRFSDYAAGRLNPGLARKSDDNLWVTPLCNHHHQGDQHTRSERAFWSDLGIDVNALCRDLSAAYPDVGAAEAALRRHARKP